MFRIRWFQCRRYCRRFDLLGRLITSANGGQDRTCVYVSRWFSWLLFSFILFFSFQVAWVALVENVLCTNLLNNFLKKDFGLFRWMNSVMVLTVNSQIRPSSTQKSIYRVLQELSIGVSHDIVQVKFKDLQIFLLSFGQWHNQQMTWQNFKNKNSRQNRPHCVRERKFPLLHETRAFSSPLYLYAIRPLAPDPKGRLPLCTLCLQVCTHTQFFFLQVLSEEGKEM